MKSLSSDSGCGHRPGLRDHLESMSAVLSPLAAVALSLLTILILFLFLDIPAASTIHLLIIESLGNAYGLSELLLKASPIALCGLGLLLCFRAGVWNIGAEGQYLIGAIAASYLALEIGESGQTFSLFWIISFGAIGGGAWAAIAALLKRYFDANEVLTTIMLNYIAVHLLMYMVNGPLKDPAGFNFPESAIFSSSVLLPKLHDDYRVNIMIGAPIILSLLLIYILAKTRSGYEIKIIGASQNVAKHAGIRVELMQLSLLVVAGALAGIAGAAEVIGPVEQLIPQLAVGYGYSAIICVFLGRQHPLGVLLAACFMGMIYTGFENIQLEYALPNAIALVCQALSLFYLLLADYLFSRFKLRSGN